MTTENMTTCRKCGSEFCYEVIEEGVYASWSCMLCGFRTNTYMLNNTAELIQHLSTLPKLYQELKYVDSDGFVWVPEYRRVDGVGEIYASLLPNGDWCWTVAILDGEEELFRNPDGTYREYKADQSQSKNFHKEAFAGALHSLGLI